MKAIRGMIDRMTFSIADSKEGAKKDELVRNPENLM